MDERGYQMAMQMSAPNVEEIARKRSLGGAIELCAELGGYTLDKQLSTELAVDKAQLSRWHSGTEGILWPKLEKLMGVCGNDAPVLWMLHQRGYDLHSLRKQESELEREIRTLRESLAHEQMRSKVLADAINGRK